MLQMVKNWRQEHPGNKARSNTIPGSHVWLDGSLGMRLNDVHAHHAIYIRVPGEPGNEATLNLTVCGYNKSQESQFLTLMT